MDEAKVREVCESYRAVLMERGEVWTKMAAALGFENAAVVPRRLSDTQAQHTTSSGELSPGDILCHQLYMLDEIPNLMAAGRIEKAMRWLGWLQGALWGLGMESLEEAKKRNMPDEEKGG